MKRRKPFTYSLYDGGHGGRCDDLPLFAGDPVAVKLAEPEPKPAPPTHRQMAMPDLATEARSLSSGTIANLTGLMKYADVDAAQEAFARWCETHTQYTNWITAWQAYTAEVRA